MVEIDIVAFLWMMHNETIDFVIDSFASNNMVFLMCMLWQMGTFSSYELSIQMIIEYVFLKYKHMCGLVALLNTLKTCQ